MSPSLVHEDRVALLDQLSHLVGCTAPCTVGLGLKPDVLRSHPSLRLLFLGEAKHCETPGNAETQRRLRLYLRALRSLQRHGFASRVALCGDPLEAARWSRLLELLAVSERAVVASIGATDLTGDERVVWLDLLPAGAARRSPFLLDR